MDGSSIGREISLGIHVSARQHNPDPLIILSRGYPRILQSSVDGQLQATGAYVYVYIAKNMQYYLSERFVRELSLYTLVLVRLL